MSFLAKKHTGTTRITKLRSNANRMRFMIKTNNDRINLPEKPDSVGWVSRGFFLFALPWVGVCSWGNVWFRRWLFLGDAQHLSVVEHIISIPWTRKFLFQNVYFAREQDKLSSALSRNMPYFLCLISCQIRLRPELYDVKTYYDNCTISVSSFLEVVATKPMLPIQTWVSFAKYITFCFSGNAAMFVYVWDIRNESTDWFIK